MQAGPAPLPELDALGLDPIAAPVRGSRDGRRLVPQAVARGLEFALEPVPTLDHRALWRCPRADPGQPWPAREVRVRLLLRYTFRTAFDADLSFEESPVKEERRIGVSLELASLATAVVAEEDKASLVDRLQQNDAGSGPAGEIDRGNGHGRGFG